MPVAVASKLLNVRARTQNSVREMRLASGSAGSALVEVRRKETSMFEGLLQPIHLLVILMVAILLFGPKKLPELGKGLGEGIRGFKKAMTEHNQEK
jgi:sec-independent protein translocase protein TatA